MLHRCLFLLCVLRHILLLLSTPTLLSYARYLSVPCRRAARVIVHLVVRPPIFCTAQLECIGVERKEEQRDRLNNP